MIGLIIGLLTRFNSVFGLPLPLGLLIGIENIIWLSPQRVIIFVRTAGERGIMYIGRLKLVAIIRLVGPQTPAIIDFYRKKHTQAILRHVNLKNLSQLPETDKKSYIERYSLFERAQKGLLPKTGTIYQSAGTTGEPTVWSESFAEELFFRLYVQFAVDYTFHTKNHRYTIINCWAMGAWPTGIGFSQAVAGLGQIMNIGTNADEALKAIKKIGHAQPIIMAGYPPFLKYLIELGEVKKVNWRNYTIHLISGGEGFQESWRSFMLKKLGSRAIIRSGYGSTDLGLGHAFETELAVTIRAILQTAMDYLKDEAVAKSFWRERVPNKNFPFHSRNQAEELIVGLLSENPDHEQRVPMIFQFDPTTYWTENSYHAYQGKRVREFITTYLRPKAALPKIKYNIHDEGGVVLFSQARKTLAKAGFDLQSLGLNQKRWPILPLPFLFVYGRSDGTISVDGANIYPEDIKDCLIKTPQLNRSINSFQMSVSPAHRFGLSFELKESQSIARDEQKKLETIVLTILPRFSKGYQELVTEKLASAQIDFEWYEFGRGPFEMSPMVSGGKPKYRFVKI